jgi:hypothetical protein
MAQIVYILTNPAMPDLIKIGITSNTLNQRIAELSRSSGVPLPFEVYYACEVDDMENVEKNIHDAFDDFRINPRREFFKMNPERVISALKLTKGIDVTPKEDIADSKEELDALNLARNRRPRFNFNLADIPLGSMITFSLDESKIAEVISDTEVKYNDEILSLNQITLRLFNEKGKRWKSVQGPAYWMYEGQTLDSRRKNLESIA